MAYERVGCCCELRPYEALGQTWYDVYQDTRGIIYSGLTYENAKYKAENDSLCIIGVPGSLDISSTPSGAKIFLDGVDQGKVTPAVINELAAKSYAVKLTLPYYEEWTDTVDVIADKTTLVSATLETIKFISPCPPMGDVNGDGFVDINDALLIAQYSVGTIDLTADQLKRADVNADGVVNIFDSLMIAQFIVGTITTFPLCSTIKWKCSNPITNTCIRDDINGTFNTEALCKASSSCQPSTQTSNNNLLYIGLAAAGLAVIYLSMKKK